MAQISKSAALLQELIQCPSITPADHGALEVMGRHLSALGFDVHHISFDDVNTPTIANLYARIGTQSPCLVFAGHTDVVPTGPETEWHHPPFAGAISDDVLWGRGAIDMKGGLAASLGACEAFLHTHKEFNGSIAFLITGDEEGPAINGTRKLLAWAHERGERFDHCILGEPTNRAHIGDMIKIGRRGSLTGRLIVHGTQGHVGYPHLADNPIHHIVRLLAALTTPALDQGSAHFEPSTLAITSVDVGNAATNVIPAQAQAVFNIRFNDLWTPDTLAAHITERLAHVADGARYSLHFDPTHSLSFLTKQGPFIDLVTTAVMDVTGRKPELSTSGGTSDARFIQAYCEVVECGLVGQTMHKIDECVALSDLDQLTQIYQRVLELYFIKRDNQRV
jgi:succinyl-diaminopimelate desuccinylase